MRRVEQHKNVPISADFEIAAQPDLYASQPHQTWGVDQVDGIEDRACEALKTNFNPLDCDSRRQQNARHDHDIKE